MANGQWQQSVFERGSDQDILELKKLVKQDQAIAEGSPAAGFAIITLTSGSIRLSKVATLAPQAIQSVSWEWATKERTLQTCTYVNPPYSM